MVSDKRQVKEVGGKEGRVSALQFKGDRVHPSWWGKCGGRQERQLATRHLWARSRMSISAQLQNCISSEITGYGTVSPTVRVVFPPLSRRRNWELSHRHRQRIPVCLWGSLDPVELTTAVSQHREHFLQCCHCRSLITALSGIGVFPYVRSNSVCTLLIGYDRVGPQRGA